MMDDLTRFIQAMTEAIKAGRILIQITVNLPVQSEEKSDESAKFEVSCPYCKDWQRSYSRKDNAMRALKGHLRQCSEWKKRRNEVIPDGLLELVRSFERENHNN